MKSLSGILFDFNGTLFFDSYMHLEAFRRAFSLYTKNIPSDDYMIKNIFGRTNEAIFKDNIKPDATPEECEKFRTAKVEFYYDICRSSPGKMRLVDGACEMLDYIKKEGIPYCMSTGSDRDEMEFFFDRLGLERWFSWDNVVYTDGSFQGKPMPDGYLLAAKRISLSPSECLVFEDGTAGMRAARAAGAGAVIAVYESTLPSPMVQVGLADMERHDLTGWREILETYGIMR